MNDVKETSNNSDIEVGCCGNFWGPFKPLVGGHTLTEAATSSFLPITIVLVYRTMFTILLGSTFTFYFLTGRYQIMYFTVWSHWGLSMSFAFLTALSFFYVFVLHRTPWTLPSRMAGLAVVLFQVFASAALFLDVIYWAMLYDPEVDDLDLPNLAGHAFNLVCVLFEMVLSLRMNFKLFYILFIVLYVIIYLVYLWIYYLTNDYFVYEMFDFRGKTTGFVFANYMGTLAWALISAFIIVVFSRLNRLPCVPQPRERSQSSNERLRYDVENGITSNR